MSLSLQPNWPKGFFRKGKALRGLKVPGRAGGCRCLAEPCREVVAACPCGQELSPSPRLVPALCRGR